MLLIRAKRINLTFKYHLQMQMLLLGLIFTSFGCSIMIIYFTKKLIKGSKSFFKKSIKIIKNFRLKRLNNSNTRFVQHIKIN